MADLGQLISVALSDLEDQLLELELWLKAVNEPDHPPAWVYPMMRMHDRLRTHYEAVSRAVHPARAGGSS